MMILVRHFESAVKAATGGLGAHGVLVTAGADQAYRQALHLLRPLGTLICVGIPRLDFFLPVSPFETIVKGTVFVKWNYNIRLRAYR